jgi:hypothetical protein
MGGLSCVDGGVGARASWKRLDGHGILDDDRPANRRPRGALWPTTHCQGA